MLFNFILVGAGGAIGSMLRYFLAIVWGPRSFPYATLTANIIGCFVIGILFGLGLRHSVSNYSWKFLSIGICGGFTTFSAFSLEGVEFLQQQRFIPFILYLVSTLTVGLVATFIGYTVVRN